VSIGISPTASSGGGGSNPGHIQIGDDRRARINGIKVCQSAKIKGSLIVGFFLHPRRLTEVFDITLAKYLAT
jgi:hypothetical protein